MLPVPLRSAFILMIALLGVFLGRVSAAATPVVDANGILTGASGVVVDQQSYNVSFQDGACSSLFNGCDHTTDFHFQTGDSAVVASQALLDQVLLDSVYSFDSSPGLTRGCAGGSCIIITPFSFNPALPVGSGIEAVNRMSGITDFISSIGFYNSEFDTSSSSEFTWAIWSLAQPVPEVDKSWMLLAGIVCIAIAYRKRLCAETSDHGS